MSQKRKVERLSEYNRFFTLVRSRCLMAGIGEEEVYDHYLFLSNFFVSRERKNYPEIVKFWGNFLFCEREKIT